MKVQYVQARIHHQTNVMWLRLRWVKDCHVFLQK